MLRTIIETTIELAIAATVVALVWTFAVAMGA
jgi:hypothetical protein